MKVLEVSSLDEVRAAIKAERLRQGLTQQQLEDLSGVSRRTISSMEVGRFSRIQRLCLICLMLLVMTKYILS